MNSVMDVHLANNIATHFHKWRITELRSSWICSMQICVDRSDPKHQGGKSFFLLIVDDYSRYMWVELLATKDEAFRCFKRVKALAETERSGKLRTFCSDRGGEFNSIEFKEYCDEHGVKHFTTTPYTPQQNDVVERRNRTVVEMARCLLKSKNVPGEFWGEAVSTAVYLLNHAQPRACKEGHLMKHGTTENPRCIICVLLVVLLMSRRSGLGSASYLTGRLKWCSSAMSLGQRATEFMIQ
jgi:transposase InsO family protein